MLKARKEVVVTMTGDELGQLLDDIDLLYAVAVEHGYADDAHDLCSWRMADIRLRHNAYARELYAAGYRSPNKEIPG